MPERSADDIDVNDIISSINLNKGLVKGLLDLNCDELAAVMAEIANQAEIPTATIKKTRADLPSFSTMKWSHFALQFGLPLNPMHIHYTMLQSFKTPRYRLPPSLHKVMFENGWHWQDVYRERHAQTREEARMRILDLVCQLNNGYLCFVLINDVMQYIVPIVALFQGRILDMPEEAKMATKYSTGSEFEHGVSTWFNLCRLSHISQICW